MKERPILFSGPMIRAIRDGRKSQTRRVVKPQPIEGVYKYDGVTPTFQWRTEINTCRPIWPDVINQYCPYGQPGDRLWVRETWHPFGIGTSPNWISDRVIYRADNEGLQPFDGCTSWPLPAPVVWAGKQSSVWKPSIFMPRWACRTVLDVVSVKVERLHHIGELSAKAEGVEPKSAVSVARGESYLSYCEAFSDLWDTINAKRGYGWATNPWVWVVEFKVVQP